MEAIKAKIAEALSKKMPLPAETIQKMIEIPVNEELGDFSFPCFYLAQSLKISPAVVAVSIAANTRLDGIEKIISSGPYINFFIDRKGFGKLVIDGISVAGKQYGAATEGAGKTIVIDFSSVNIAKPFHIGHLKSTAIGNSLYKIYSFLGYSCVGINHLGDWGTQFGKLIVAYKKWGNPEEKYSVRGLVALYVRFHKEVEKDEQLDEEAKAAFKRLEDGEEDYVSLWKMFREISLQEFERVYRLLDIGFDSWDGESFYNDKISTLIDRLEKAGLLLRSNGADIVDLERYGMPPCIIKRSDGASLYATRDLAAAFYRKDKYDFHKILYVVGNAQKLHFRQIFKVIELMGFAWSADLVHVDFGLVSLQDGAMSTRRGIVVYLEDVLKDAISKVGEIVKDKDMTGEERDDLARKVGTGAVIFSALSSGRQGDSVFSLEKILNFEGDTCPYIQYTRVRINSLLNKAAGEPVVPADLSLLVEECEFSLLKLLAGFPAAVKEAADTYEPAEIARYLIGLSKSFNKFYHSFPVIDIGQPDLQAARLSLCSATRIVIQNGLSLLGIECPEKM